MKFQNLGEKKKDPQLKILIFIDLPANPKYYNHCNCFWAINNQCQGFLNEAGCK